MFTELSALGSPLAPRARETPGADRDAEMASAERGREKGRCEENRRLCACVLGTIITIFVLTTMVAIRHVWRRRSLEPLLDLIVSAGVCHNIQRGACELNFSQAAAGAFDLREHESPVLGFLYHQVARGEREEMRQVLCGANVRLQDADGSVYGLLQSLPGAQRRISSHQSSRPQYGVPVGRVLSSLLLGTRDNSTWLQLEGSPWDPWHQPVRSLGHVLDFLEYGIIRRNVGPLGTSKATDRRPLLAGPPAPTSEACPALCGQPTTGAPVQAGKAGALASKPAVALPQVRSASQEVQATFRAFRRDAWEQQQVSRAESLVKLGGGLGGAAAMAGGLRLGARSAAQRLAPG
mmetsp:Transcript_76416/g.236646  ORF Transcript_76416/g.236646 Transcript_76416/m.236646 type:complete len:350 (+) Transcript_76416:50-1099(+)|eukprot:CAMPEP_0204582286 /NCGR_PEP_ID=MMETSP0661-20131031/45127_1 /ASSEMBLY_ACC=CAM_ASM_000606 /TAXON_ID=109239 /ORGANISM="Alexandrium margalefi, Strain AMGDE01CS-322" /LENGTH=349 /DNA_ID=CAMNT_0051591555 /DNA_START=45 /DNA_END=1094 /DNA_ORIENTATION=+